jgi:hypothetical protein
MSALEKEIAFRVAGGGELLTVAQFRRRFKALGYSLDRRLDCRCMARYLDDGRTYPCRTTGLRETDTGMSAFHYQARRDDKFKAMQELRGQILAVSRGAILEV